MTANKKGFTIVELIIAITLTLVVTAAVYNVYMYAINTMEISRARIRDRSEANYTTRLLEQDLREIVVSSGFESIALADSANIIFYSDVDNDDLPEKLQYELQDNALNRSITQPDTDTPPYTYSGQPQTKVIATHITNNALFRYFSSFQYEISAVPLNGSQRQTVKIVKINISVDSTPGQEPPATNLELDVNLRNQQ